MVREAGGRLVAGWREPGRGGTARRANDTTIGGAVMGRETRVDLLGPVRVTADGVLLDVGGPKPRLLLARLALAAPRAVTTDDLIEALWHTSPPATARKTLQRYISGLRRVLGADIVTSAGQSYVLDLPADAIDVHRLQALLEAAAHAQAAGDRRRAWERYGTALALWRGRPMGDLGDALFVTAETQRLEGVRLAALEQQAEVGLDLGHHAELIPLLQDLVERHPLRERLWKALMTALYQAGRQAEALDAYRRLRSLLAEELGLEPSDAVQDVQRRILVHDVALEPVFHDGPDTQRGPALPGNLPRRLTSVVGREQLTAELTAVLRDVPALTLVGPGGVGKSTLALEVAAAAARRFRDGVWLCELAPLSRGDSLPHALAATLGVQQRPGLGIGDSVVEYCRDRQLLIVLDNCEHLIDEVAGLVHRIVSSCAGTVVLATSRQSLDIAAEHVWPVPPLGADDARALFGERARIVQPGFRLRDANVAAVDEICRRLDGLPLAIELAAARVSAMTAAEIAGYLDERFRLLGHGPRTAEERHQNLRAAIDWSHGLLGAREQQLLAALSVFAGGFDATAARRVCAPDLDELAVADLLAGLVGKSMVVADTGGPWAGYHLLETIRAYARERLEHDGAAAATRRRHAEHFAAVAERAGAGLNGPDEAHWVDRLSFDLDNLRAAFESAVAVGEVDLALRLVAHVPEFTFWRVGYESTTWAETAMSMAGASSHPLHPAVCAHAARGAWMVGDFARAAQLADLAAEQHAGGTPRTCHPGDVRADAALYDGRVDQALAHYERETDRARHQGDPIRLAWALYYVGVCHAVRRTPALGTAAAQEALAVARASGNPTAVAVALYGLGLTLKKSDPRRALALFEESVSVSESVRNRWFRGIALMEAASTRAVHGDPHQAAGAFLGVLEQWDRFGDQTQHWLNLRYVVRLLGRLRDVEGAAVLHHALIGATRPSPLDERHLAALGDALGPEGLAAAAAQGAAMGPADAVAYARVRLEEVLETTGRVGADSRVRLVLPVA
jgi:predicted ATPase/DNA-binding SARP family transcriptional activator